MAFMPFFGQVLDKLTGSQGAPPSTLIFSAEPCACWLSRGRQNHTPASGFPAIAYQVAMAYTRLYVPPGWVGNPPVWNPSVADRFRVKTTGLGTITVSPVWCGPMWAGTPQAHSRFDCTLWVQPDTVPTPSFPTGRSDGFTTTFDVYRPFGAAAASTAGLVGVFYSDAINGRGSYSGGNYLTWSDFIDVASTVDVRDGLGRGSGLDTTVYSDGDEVRVPSGAAVSRYVVVKVSNMRDLTGVLFKRVYLLRDQPHWPGP